MSHLQTARLICYALFALLVIGLLGKHTGDAKIFDQLVAVYLILCLPVGGYLAWVFFICENPERINHHQ